MSEPRRSTRARAREEAAPVPPETPKETPVKGGKTSLKRKRASIAVKESTPSTSTGEEGAEPAPKETLPLKLVDGAPLPTVPEPQPLDLPASEWQNIQQSGVLEASFERSRAVWISGANFRTFHTHFTWPKKVAERTDEDKAKMQRQKELNRNFPQIGGDAVIAQLVIEPHTFPIRLFGPREMTKPVQKKPPPTYGSWPNHSQHSQPNQYTQYNSGHQPYQQPQPRPPPPKPVQKASPPAPTSTPAPDPVIHMLAARAGTDPELKAVMKIVANGTASKEQLEFFQGHINELTAILAKQKADAAKSKPVAPSPAPKPVPPSPAVPPTHAQKVAPYPPQPPKPIAPPPISRPYQPVQQQQATQPPPQQYAPTPPQAPLQQPTNIPQSRPSYTHNYAPPQPYHQIQQVAYNPQPRNTYRPLVFEFQEGNNDKFYFPSYSFMEWLPNGSGVKISFLITKMKPKPKPEVVVKTPSTPAPKAAPPPTPGATPAATPNVPSQGVPAATPSASIQALSPLHVAAPAAPPPYVPPTRIEDFDERKDIADIEFYQPVTVLLLTDHYDIKQALPRAVRPPDVVEKYMEEVFDKCKRADETYLAFRLPKGGEDAPERRARSGDVTPVVATPVADTAMVGLGLPKETLEKKKAGRPRKGLVE